MRIAVAVDKSFSLVAGHAGQAKRWLVFEVAAGEWAREIDRIELERPQVFHHFQDEGPHPLDGVAVVIAASAGEGFGRRMTKRGVESVLTAESDPLKAVTDHVERTLAPPRPRPISGLLCKAFDLFSKH
ncbi:hypothetical protein CKO38_08100 [Rhodospirillum rubrum]|uniref:NifB/NifX family molybdenum-iron cluster-binding protein n=1 Tax=Rhodospirillum rubrum TaxID=1085 RepID=UPI0019081F6A|nr:hypothetical protein [Rhodospirillum rubrum]MBK1664784.1 hypothetical protein [Rhodospirillum rubrum]MBK1676632.1 hypothetical protein [Rhodospirillum rubrum]